MAETQGLEVSLGPGGPIDLDVRFSCEAGELVALLGPSGAGKTTILRSIAGLYKPKTAFIRYGDAIWTDTKSKIDRPAHLRRVGFVFQSYALFPHLTALENVEAAIGGMSRDERRGEAQRLLELMDLQDYAHRRPDALSGGQQQRVALARAMAREPDVFLLDEPLSAVDRRTRRKLREALNLIRKALKAPILLVTHDLDEATELANRLVVLDQGKLLQMGGPAEVLSSPACDRVKEILDI